MAVAAGEVIDMSQQFAKAVSEPMFSFRIQPGKYKYPNRHRTATGKVKMGKRQFVPSPVFPDGILISFPSWFVATVGIAVILHIYGSLEKLAKGETLTEEEKAGFGFDALKDFWQATSPVGIVSKWAGL